ncbi:capsid assembly protein [Pelagibacter phage Greip EXVC021P]|nr:capsid assembly protein [Pelagibacter phage Greip EXVC021P]
MSSEQITQTNVPVEETTQTTTDTPQQTVSSTTTEQPTVSKSWKETISEEFRNDPNISKFTEIDALAKSYINATRMIGQDKVAVPNENSTDDQWNEVYGKLGRPESPDKYKLEVNSDLVPLDESAVKSFAENAHQLGLNNKQAQGILEYYKNSMEGSVQQARIDTETAQANSEAELRKEWGRSFDENIKKAGAVAKANMDETVLNMELKDGTRLGDHPAVIKGFANIANILSEDKLVGTESENVDQGADYEAEISKLVNDRDGPYWNKSHPDHDKIVQQVFTLRTMMNG